MPGRRDRARRVVEPELQGRAGGHRPRRAIVLQVAAGAGDRPGGIGRTEQRAQIGSRGPRRRQRLGPGRDALGGLRRRRGWSRAGCCACRRHSARQAMAIGTAGYTAALCVMALQKHGTAPATARSSSPAPPAAWARSRWRCSRRSAVVASTGRSQEADYLRGLGASAIIDRTNSAPGKPLQTERWAGVVDAVGSHARQRARRRAFTAPSRGSRPGPGRGLPEHGAAVHPARRHALRHQLRVRRQHAAPEGVGPARAAPRSGQARA